MTLTYQQIQQQILKVIEAYERDHDLGLDEEELTKCIMEQFRFEESVITDFDIYEEIDLQYNFYF